MKIDEETIYKNILNIIRNNIPENGEISLRIVIDEYRKQYPYDNVTTKKISEVLNTIYKNLGMYGKISKSEHSSHYIKRFDINNSKKGIRNQFVEKLNLNYSKLYNFIKDNFTAGETISGVTVWEKYHENTDEKSDEKFDYYYARAMETLLRDGKIKPGSENSQNILSTPFIIQEVKQEERNGNIREY